MLNTQREWGRQIKLYCISLERSLKYCSLIQMWCKFFVWNQWNYTIIMPFERKLAVTYSDYIVWLQYVHRKWFTIDVYFLSLNYYYFFVYVFQFAKGKLSRRLSIVGFEFSWIIAQRFRKQTGTIRIRR